MKLATWFANREVLHISSDIGKIFAPCWNDRKGKRNKRFYNILLVILTIKFPWSTCLPIHVTLQIEHVGKNH